MEIQIYVVRKSDYAKGTGNGTWINLVDKTYEDVLNSIDEDDYIIADYIAPFTIKKNWVLEDIFDTLDEIESINNDGSVNAFIEFYGEWNLRVFRDSYMGEYESLSEYAVCEFDELYAFEIPAHLREYINYELYENEIELDGVKEINGYVFRPRW